MKTILILMDSLNRHMLNTYKDTWVKTPNIDRFAKKSIVFTNHWIGSAPCMPARRDILTGRLNFLERNWGPIEPFDITLPQLLRENDIFTHITTDHTHYVELGGENYCQSFNTWDIQRGQEYDPWVSRVKRPKLPDEYYGTVSEQYELNRQEFIEDANYPTPRTFKSACKWLDDNKGADNYFLTVETFDPHEPFDSPDEFLKLYNDEYEGPRYDWSGYDMVDEDSKATLHLKKKYAATLSMADKWLGKFLDTLDKHDMWKDTLIFLTTDHGHLLGEHGWTGKNRMHVFNELAHIPFMVHLPGDKRAGERLNHLTQNIDLMPTILDYYGIEIPKCTHGFSLKGILEGSNKGIRENVIYGWHGKAVNITDGEYTYFRAPKSEDNSPCYSYCGIPTTLWKYMGNDCIDEIEMGRFLKHTDYPVYKIPIKKHNQIDQRIKHVKNSMLFNIQNDYGQQKPINDKEIEEIMCMKLKKAMEDADSPIEQFERLGL